MRRRYLFCLFGCALYITTVTAYAVELQPFEWHYDVVYTYKKRAFNGRGTYRLTRKENDIWSFSLSARTHNRFYYSSVIEVLLYADPQRVVVPIESKHRETIFGIPHNEKIELDLNHETPYEALSVVLRLLYDLQFQNPVPEQWKLWLADEKKEEKYVQFVLRGEERLQTMGRIISCYHIEKIEIKPTRSLHIWIAKEGNHIVKIIQKDKNKTVKMEASDRFEYDRGISI